jgi:hypothetical protein
MPIDRVAAEARDRRAEREVEQAAHEKQRTAQLYERYDFAHFKNGPPAALVASAFGRLNRTITGFGKMLRATTASLQCSVGACNTAFPLTTSAASGFALFGLSSRNPCATASA